MLIYAESKEMKGKFFTIRPFKSLPCRPNEFKVKGKDAVLSEFGAEDKGKPSECKSEQIKKWGCPNRTFKTKPYAENKQVADNYNLTEDEYNELCKALEDVFSVGTCAWCV